MAMIPDDLQDQANAIAMAVAKAEGWDGTLDLTAIAAGSAGASKPGPMPIWWYEHEYLIAAYRFMVMHKALTGSDHSVRTLASPS